MDPVRLRRRAAAMSTFALHNPQWMDLAAEVLFRNDKLRDEENYNIQNAVAEALKLAHKMGAEGREPPTPAHAARSYQRPPEDPEIEAIAAELHLLAWSPKKGTPAPEGYVGYKLRQRLNTQGQTAPIKPTVRRRK